MLLVLGVVELSARGSVRPEVWELLEGAKRRAQTEEEEVRFDFPVTGGAFLVRPYLQLGDVPPGVVARELRLLWQAEDLEADWAVAYRPSVEGPWLSAEAPAMRHRAGTVDAAEGVVIGQRHDPHPTVGGQVGHLVGVAPAVADCRVHVEIGQHDAQSSGRLPGSGLKLLSNVTDFLGFPVGDD